MKLNNAQKTMIFKRIENGSYILYKIILLTLSSIIFYTLKLNLIYVRIFIKNLHSSKNEKIHQEKILSFLYNLFYFESFVSNHPLSGHTIVDNGTLRTFTNTSLHNIEYDIKREIIAAKKIDGYFYRTTNHDSHKRGPIVRLHPTHETYVIAQNKSPTFQPFLLRSSTAFFLHIYISPRLLIATTVFFFRYARIQR